MLHFSTLLRLFVIGILSLLTPRGMLAQTDAINFNRDVRPILSNNCFHCHGPDEKVRKGKLRLDMEEGAFESVVVPGKPEQSSLIERLTASDPAEIMPPAKSGKKLTKNEIEILTKWVKTGAKYTSHWSYVTPLPPAVPSLERPEFLIRNPIDAFVSARLVQEGLKPQPEADKFAIVRRVSLDLTGLPPTREEVETFCADRSPQAYEKLVDRLLAKASFGEHWARFWLDLARYADSAGYADDPPRTIWKYRDYVIQSFNSNKPFDQFTIEQLAGDLLPNPTTEQLIATAFHRNTMTNNEGGTNDEEFRNVAVVDRVNTTFTVWMATSIACAQCHTHKYDPILQKEYFQVFALFNNTADADRSDESPTLPIWTPEQLKRKTELEERIAALEALLKSKKSDENKQDRDQLAALKKQLSDLKPFTTVPIFKELVGQQRRKTHLQYRGNFLDLGEEITAGVPALFPTKLPHPPRDRLELARWLMSAENPLTARVIANRFWEQIFGVGLVRTSEEFGAQGEQPSHPELLDWLATELVASHWNVKHFLKLLVMSAAYRQSSKVTPELLEKDPDNRLLARGPRVRLTAEMIRDQALFASGLLSTKLFGPSVKPPQPNLGLSAAFGGSIDWQTSVGEDRYRRGIYTLWRRSNPYPSMSTFDAPNRDTCIVRRARTNTPLQALVTLNDPVYIEAAQGLARRMIETGGATPAEKAAFGLQTCLVRQATDNEVRRLVKLYEDARSKFAREPSKAQQFATNPLGPLPKGIEIVDAAAWTVVANVLLNLDEMLMKR